MSEDYDRLRADLEERHKLWVRDAEHVCAEELAELLERHPAREVSTEPHAKERLHWLAHDIYAYVSECIDDEMDEWQENPDRIVGLIESVLQERLGTEPAPPTPARATSDLPEQVNLDGYEDPKNHARYIGKATRQPDGTYNCLAEVYGGLALVSVRITRLAGEPRELEL